MATKNRKRSKRQVTLRMSKDEAAVIGTLDFWERFENWCAIMAEDNPEFENDWKDTAKWTSYWVEKTKDKRGEEDEL